MTPSENDKDRNPADQQPCGEQAIAFQWLPHIRSELEAQGYRVTRAANRITEALEKGENVSPEMMNHVQAQILKMHLQLDELEQWLDSIG